MLPLYSFVWQIIWSMHVCWAGEGSRLVISWQKVSNSIYKKTYLNFKKSYFINSLLSIHLHPTRLLSRLSNTSHLNRIPSVIWDDSRRPSFLEIIMDILMSFSILARRIQDGLECIVKNITVTSVIPPPRKPPKRGAVPPIPRSHRYLIGMRVMGGRERGRKSASGGIFTSYPSSLTERSGGNRKGNVEERQLKRQGGKR